MTLGRRAFGIAESYSGADSTETSTLAGAVVRADRTVEDFAFGSCTVGGRDATDAIVDLFERLDRPDVRYLFVAGVALSWYNVVDLHAVHRAVERPVFAVSFEESDGLEAGIDDAFDGSERTARREVYDGLPDRHRLPVEDPLFVRSLGVDRATAADVVEAYTEKRRPEPLRVAKRLARRVDTARRDGTIVPE